MGREIIADWRISTLECAELLKVPLNEYSINVGKIIERFFCPLTIRATKAERDDLWNVVLDVCRQAYKLNIMMRKSREEYVCDPVDTSKDEHLLSRIDYLADSFGVEGGKSDEASDEIAYILFGALSKDTLDGGRKVLEKAHVILKRK